MSCLKESSLLIVVSVFCFGIEASAQFPQFGVKVGLNLANVVVNGSMDNAFPGKELKPGLVVGAYMTYNIIPLVSVEPEVLFSMKGTMGSSTSLTLPSGSVDYTQVFNYIEVPVLLRLNLPLGPVIPFKANVYAGPDFAFNVASNEKFTGAVIPGGSLTLDTKYLSSSFDFNLAVGAGAGFDLGPTTLGLELRYTLGTGTLAKPDEGDLRNSVFAIMASVGI